MAGDSENPNVVGRSAVAILVAFMLLPGGVFVAKGIREVADRIAPRTTSGATITGVTLGETFVNRRRVPVYEVRGVVPDGTEFSFDDRRVFELADDRTPLPVRVDRSALTDRVIAVRSDAGDVHGVGGASELWLGLLALAVGIALSIIPFVMPWKTKARTHARSEGTRVPRPDYGALAVMIFAAVAIICGTLAWDLLR